MSFELSKYSPRYDKSIHPKWIVDVLRRGSSIMRFCSEVQISPFTVDQWLQDNPEFRAAYEVGLAHFAAYWEEKLMDMAEGRGRGNFNALKTILQNRLNYNKLPEHGWSDNIKSDESETPSFHMQVVKLIEKSRGENPEIFEYEDIKSARKPDLAD